MFEDLNHLVFRLASREIPQSAIRLPPSSSSSHHRRLRPILHSLRRLCVKGRRRTRYSILFRRLLLRRPPEEGRRIGGFLRPAVHKSTSIIDRVKALARVCVCLCVVRRPLVFSRNEGGGGHTHPPQVGGMWACLNQQDQRAKRETNSPKSSQIFCSLKDKQKLLSFFIPFYQLLFFFYHHCCYYSKPTLGQTNGNLADKRSSRPSSRRRGCRINGGIMML